MLRKAPRMKHVATLRSLWPMDGSEADGSGIGHLNHAIGPFLPIAPIQHDLSQFHRVWGPCSVQALCTKLYSLGLPITIDTASIKVPFPLLAFCSRYSSNTSAGSKYANDSNVGMSRGSRFGNSCCICSTRSTVYMGSRAMTSAGFKELSSIETVP
ncbi:hypothetical protein TNIN_278191 [Trichonephila inaurata madagascariensis]|uniref:Uncharacterized protein n=1 Tax=Trichonephila inaurata madagascariensis TaxID=2747483 RepID=A0A8X6MIK6_9ARAC|nr:hypothetical protein TNIN_278191 [Trichonephila inaurata madagascariensis]